MSASVVTTAGSPPAPTPPPTPGRPVGWMPGMPASVPPPDIPLLLLGAAGVGLVGVGVALVLVAGHLVANPTDDQPVAAVHLMMLAFLTTGVLGAFHQFAAVVGRRPLRSVGAARVSIVLVVAGSWALPAGFAAGANPMVAGAGAALTAGFLLAAWNLTGPLLGPGRGPSVTGLRLSLVGLLATAGFGVTYAFDRQSGERWFPLDPHLVLAHAHIGLLAWLGLTYVAVAEKLWPMFLLAHRPGRSPGEAAVRLVPTGVTVLVAGLLANQRWVTTAGAALCGAGLAAHLASLAGLVRRRRRPLELLHAFIAASAVFLVAAAVFAAIGGLGPLGTAGRSRMVSAEVAALAAWLGLALIGHAHKVVPFISWGILRTKGVTAAPDGKALLFSHLWDRRVGRATWMSSVAGFTAVVSGAAGGWSGAVAAGGALLATTGAMALGNLGIGPVRVARSVVQSYSSDS